MNHYTSAYGIDESRVNAGNGPQLDFPVVDQTKHDFRVAPAGDTRLPAGPRTRSSEAIVNQTIGFIDRHANQPFCVNVWLNDTHATLDPDAQMLERYESLMPTGVAHKHVGANALYFATVTEADRQVGRLLAHLEERGLRENTIVIFSADNGPEDIAISNASHSGVGSPGPFRGRKRSLYEGGIRVPFILRWPNGGVRAGAVDNDTVLCGADLMPTFSRLGGVERESLPTKLDGEDMSDVFRGKRRTRSKPMMWDWRFRVWGHCINKSPMLAIREGEWKLLVNPARDREELYHIPSDPMELNNQAEKHPDLVDRLAKAVLAWRAELPDSPVSEDAGSNAYPWPVGSRE